MCYFSLKKIYIVFNLLGPGVTYVDVTFLVVYTTCKDSDIIMFYSSICFLSLIRGRVVGTAI